MKKSLKIIARVFIWILGIAILISVIFLICFLVNINTIHLNHLPVNKICSFSTEEEQIEAEKLQEEGYIISAPRFFNISSFKLEEQRHVYSAINEPLMTYTHEIAEKYKNRAKLDYTVDIVKNKTLTITFSGYGYPNGVENEAEKLDKVFVFKINNLGIHNPPTLIE